MIVTFLCQYCIYCCSNVVSCPPPVQVSLDKEILISMRLLTVKGKTKGRFWHCDFYLLGLHWLTLT